MKDVWFSRRSIGLHVVIVVIVPTFAALCVWQVHRALDGNNLSWAYVFEWPFFAGYAVYMWWRFVHEVPSGEAPDIRPEADVALAPAGERNGPQNVSTESEPNGSYSKAQVPTDSETADLDAYNDYLANLAERGKPKHW
jgi:hypothetical protein